MMVQEFKNQVSNCMSERELPEGMIKVNSGYSYREEVADIDLQRDDILRGLFAGAEAVQKSQQDLKNLCEKSLVEHLQSANPGVDIADIREGSAALFSLDGELLLEMEYAPIMRGTEKIWQLKALLRQAMEELPADTRLVISAVVKAVLRLDKGQAINLAQVARLQSVKAISSPSWSEAMELLPECTEQVGVHPRFRFKKVDSHGNQKRVLENWSAITIPDLNGGEKNE